MYFTINDLEKYCYPQLFQEHTTFSNSYYTGEYIIIKVGKMYIIEGNITVIIPSTNWFNCFNLGILCDGSYRAGTYSLSEYSDIEIYVNKSGIVSVAGGIKNRVQMFNLHCFEE